MGTNSQPTHQRGHGCDTPENLNICRAASPLQPPAVAWYKQILLAGVISLLMIPAISWFVHSQHQALLYPAYTPKPIVYEGKINLQTGEIRIEKR
jgi:hypothetical protein